MVQGKIKVTMFWNWDYVACLYYCIYAIKSCASEIKGEFNSSAIMQRKQISK